jgi:hypothetical protein
MRPGRCTAFVCKTPDLSFLLRIALFCRAGSLDPANTGHRTRSPSRSKGGFVLRLSKLICKVRPLDPEVLIPVFYYYYNFLFAAIAAGANRAHHPATAGEPERRLRRHEDGQIHGVQHLHLALGEGFRVLGFGLYPKYDNRKKGSFRHPAVALSEEAWCLRQCRS